MKLPEHIAFSFLLAQFGVQQEFGPAGTGLLIAAGMLPDLDGLSVVGGWKWHRAYHRVLGHGLPVTLGGPLLLAALGSWLLPEASFVVLWAWMQIALLLHLATDICFYRWPVQLLWPISSRGLGLGWIGWNDLAPTLLLYGGTALVLLSSRSEVAAGSLGLFGLYLFWRAVHPAPGLGWATWLHEGWVHRSPRLCRWLTGDFVT